MVVNVAAHYGPRYTMLMLGPATAAGLVLIARRSGLSFAELGLGRQRLRRGAGYAAGVVAVVAVGYAVAAALPATRPALLDERYQRPVAAAVGTALVVLPLATVLPEEIAFRGVLWAAFVRESRPAVATAATAVLFGLWHVLPSLRLHKVNPAVAGLVGDGPAAAALSAGGAVLFTALAGVVLCELRRRSGSLMAPIALHWAVNGIGMVVTAVVARP